MPIFDTFHERQARARKGGEDVYVYDIISQPLRVQIIQIMEEVLGNETEFWSGLYDENIQRSYRSICQVMRKALGTFNLAPISGRGRREEAYLSELKDFLLQERDAEKFMSALELVCRMTENVASKSAYRGFRDAEEAAKGAIGDINSRLKQHAVGYEYDTEIIRIDSELVHVEAVKPALALLRDGAFKTAEGEFLKAHEHFRSGDYQDALTNALKAFESTMKIIIAKRGWAVDPKAAAKDLIDVCYQNGLIPTYWQGYFGGLRAMLESGIPTVRNKAGGHGGGPTPNTVPEYLAAYALHMTASTIVFLVNAENALP